MKFFASALAVAATACVLGSVLAAAGCSSTTVAPPVDPNACDSSQCLPGNACLTVGAETKCRKTCSSNQDAATSCPFGYTCVGSNTALCQRLEGDAAPVCGKNFKGGVFACPNGPPNNCAESTTQPGKWCCQESVCIKDAATVTKNEKVWGAHCNPTGGKENPDCDAAQSFYCFAQSPGDGDAYCTRYDCTTDRDCGAGFYCGDWNVAPNATTIEVTVQQTQKVCIRREHCSPCNADVDCPTRAGVRYRCAQDNGYAGFCSAECEGDKDCPRDTVCSDGGGLGVKTCYPRAGSCTGDGSFCSPCRSDRDCGEDGACLRSKFSTERSCAKPAVFCKAPPRNEGSQRGRDFDCPAPPETSPVKQGVCLFDVFASAPSTFCHGLYAFGDDEADLGCWSVSR